jgi:hypothetical protein
MRNILQFIGCEWRDADDTKRKETIEALNDKTKMIGNHRSEAAYQILLVHTTQDEYRKQLFNMVLESSHWSWECLQTCLCTPSEYVKVFTLHKYALIKKRGYLHIMETFDGVITDYVKSDLVDIIIQKEDYELAKQILRFMETIPFPQEDIIRLQSLLVAERLIKAK